MISGTVSDQIAKQLLDIGAIKLQPDNPFTWASGWKSPIYCDNRISLSYPEVRNYICNALSEAIESEYKSADVIAGVATAAIAQGALVAAKMNLPFVYVRSSPKDHGRENLIEGEIKKGQSVVVIEDLISTGKSSLKAVGALRDAGCEVKGMISVFNYGFEEAENNFNKYGCRFISLCNYSDLINHALKNNFISKEESELLNTWRTHPETWGQDIKTH